MLSLVVLDPCVGAPTVGAVVAFGVMIFGVVIGAMHRQHRATDRRHQSEKELLQACNDARMASLAKQLAEQDVRTGADRRRVGFGEWNE
jgi:hypothetical protein